MASSITLPPLQIQGTPIRSSFLGQNISYLHPKKHTLASKHSKYRLKTCAKFDLFQLLGGRGLCNGEEGLQKELKRNPQELAVKVGSQGEESSASSETLTVDAVPENAFEKELMGLTGGFPGGEKGLKKFVQENPPPKKQPSTDVDNILALASSKKPKPPQLPLLMPGMVAIVKNPKNPYYMYCGIVQRITDGKAGVLFEGGNWDRLITFRLDELERREKGPPGKNPKSAIIETLLETESQ